MTIGLKIRELRTKEKLSQIELAKKLGVSNQAISDYERGRMSPNRKNLNKISEIFQVPVESLLILDYNGDDIKEQRIVTLTWQKMLDEKDKIIEDLRRDKEFLQKLIQEKLNFLKGKLSGLLCGLNPAYTITYQLHK